MWMTDVALVSPKESAKAYQAFVDYVNLGPTRSLRKLVAFYHKNPSYLKQLAAEQLDSATELKTTTYVNILGEYHRRISDEPRRQIMELNALHGIYDRVKPETPQSSDGPHITVNFAFVEVTKPQ
jgi:ABC-type transporter MlaC component